MKKQAIILVVGICVSWAVMAQSDYVNTSVVQPEITKGHRHHRASAYDTNAVYFNKWKINIIADIGYSNIDQYLTGSYNVPGILGNINPAYTDIISPTFNFSASYGFTEKSALGFNCSFAREYINPTPSYSGIDAGSLSMFTTRLRYMHCIRTWRFLYYGVEWGISFIQGNLQASMLTTYFPSQEILLKPSAGWFAGFRYPLAPNLWIHYEIQEGVPLVSNMASFYVGEGFGLNYCFDTRKNYHKPVKIDPALGPVKLVTNEDRLAYKDFRIKDTIKYLSKHKRSVYDSLNPYYNKGKWSVSADFGNSSIEGAISSNYGTLHSNYNQTIYPPFSLAVDYGVGPKHSFGLDVLYERVNYYEHSGSAYYSQGSVAVFLMEVRYVHCMWSWKYFYYGAKMGYAILNPQCNTSIFYGGSSAILPQITISAGAFVGVRVPITEAFSFHGETDFTGPIASVDIGVNYRFKAKRARKNQVIN